IPGMVEPMVRRLPVLQNTEPEDQRPAWHWLLIGAGFIVTVWLPLGMLGSWAGSRIVSSWLGAAGSVRSQECQQYAAGAVRLLVVLSQSGLSWLAYALAGLIAGLRMGRFGTRAQVREAVGGGGVASAGLVVLAVLGGALSAPLV